MTMPRIPTAAMPDATAVRRDGSRPVTAEDILRAIQAARMKEVQDTPVFDPEDVSHFEGDEDTGNSPTHGRLSGQSIPMTYDEDQHDRLRDMPMGIYGKANQTQSQDFGRAPGPVSMMPQRGNINENMLPALIGALRANPGAFSEQPVADESGFLSKLGRLFR